MRVALVENTPVTHHGQVGVALHEAGAVIDVFRPFGGGALPQDGTGHDALVVFGGEQSALDDGRHPYLPELARLMRRFDASGRPVLGICLGSQILARAWGGANLLGQAPEFGWQEVRRLPGSEADPLLSALPATFRSFQWHRDTFTLPPGAAHLASSDGAAQQAFRIGHASYGMQFHFEANRAVVARWTAEFGDLADGMRPGWRRDHAVLDGRYGAEADAAGLALARAFVALI
jgi:GMP synthase-like glutamine amidotransferase